MIDTDLILESAYQTVQESKIGAKRIAATMGIGYQVLLNKLNPRNEQYKLSLIESVAIQLVTGDTRLQQTIEDQLSTEVDGEAAGAKKSLIDCAVKAAVENGDVMRAVSEALGDGRLTDRERVQCAKEIDEAIVALQETRKALILNDIK